MVEGKDPLIVVLIDSVVERLVSDGPGGLPGEPKTPEQLQQEEEARKRAEENKERTEPIPPGNREQVKPPPGGYPTAKRAKDNDGNIKPGIVINPYTGKQLNVGRNTASGTLIRDPRDGNPNHRFYVP